MLIYLAMMVRTDYITPMLVELSTPVNLTAAAHIKPACLPGQEDSQYGGQPAVVSGWGTVGSGASLNSALHQVTVTVFNDSGKEDILFTS